MFLPEKLHNSPNTSAIKKGIEFLCEICAVMPHGTSCLSVF